MTMCNLGFAEVAKLMGTDTTAGATAFDYTAIGTGTTPAAASDTTLQTETQREVSTGTTMQTTVANDTLQLVKDSFSFGGGAEAITEIGVFNAAAAGVLISHATFSVVNCGTGDTLKTTVRHQVKQGV